MRSIKRFFTIFILVAFLQFESKAADVYFNDVYIVSSPTSPYTSSISSPVLGAKINGTNFKFSNNSINSFKTSEVGGDVSGTFSYYDNSGTLVTVSGKISRQDKVGSNTASVYFWNSGVAYFFVIPGRESNYSSGSTFNTDSSPIGTVLDNVVSTTPQIVVSSTSLSPFVSCFGSASAYQNFTVSATKLQANLTILAPAGFEISTSSNSGYTTSTLTIAPISNTVTTTTVYVRLAATDAVGSYSNNFVISSSTNSNIAKTSVSGNVYAIPSISITEADVSGVSSNDNIICASTIATLTASGGTTYLWSTSATTTSITTTPLTNTTYTVTGTTSGCSNTASVTITVLPIPNISIGSIDPITITSTIFYIPYTDNGGGGTPNQFSITSGILAMPSFSNVTLSSLTASPISVTVPESAANPYNFVISFKNASACITNYNLTLNVVDPNAASNSITLSSASGSDGQSLCVSNTISNIEYATTGATGTNITGLPLGVTGNWTSNVLTISGTPTQSGVFNYTIHLTGGSGDGSATGAITVNELPDISISGNQSDVDLVSLTASGGNTYAWSGGSSTSNAINTFDASGLYALTVTDANGCISSTVLNITVQHWGLSINGEKILDSASQINTYGKVGSLTPLTNSGKISEYKQNLASNEVAIGSQIWTNKNLDVTTYRNGDPIPEVTDPAEWGNLTTGAWCYYNNDPANGAIYGKLYNWYAVNDPRGLAPQGWHVPSISEWETLATSVGGSEDVLNNKLKAISSYWSPNTGNNITGFSALPAGYRDASNGNYYGIGTMAAIWSLTLDVSSYPRYGLFDTGFFRSWYSYSKSGGLSVRLIKD